MRISDLEFYLVEVPRSEPQGPVRTVLVRLATSTGPEGWGEAALGWRASELGLRRERLLPSLEGRSIFDVEELLTLDALAPAPLRAAVETACWDALARTVRQPLAHLWGGLFRRRVPLAARLPPDPPPRIARRARELAEQGFHALIVTGRGRPQADMQALAATRESAGDRAEVWFDARNRYDLAGACELVEAVGRDGARWLIDPLSGGDLGELARLRRRTGAAVVVSSGLHSPADVLDVAKKRAGQAVLIDPHAVGGVTAARKCTAVADAAGLAVLVGGATALGVRTAALLQLAAATPAIDSACESAYHTLAEDVLVERLATLDGQAVVPLGPGLGVEVDQAKLEARQVTRDV